MKKIAVVLAALLALGVLAGPAFAQTGSEVTEVSPGGSQERPAAPADPGDVAAGTTEVAGAQLAQTGIAVSSAAVLAFVLIAMGTLALVTSRRRRKVVAAA